MFNKFEIFGAGFCVLIMAVALYLVQIESTLGQDGSTNQGASVSATQPGIVVVEQSEQAEASRTSAYLEAMDKSGNVKSMIIDDIKIGTGEKVEDGDTVSVHYIGTLQNGQEFDSSKKRGVPFEFKVGGGQVIKGWEEGLIGMQVGGERVLVIPPEMGYGEQGIGPIPGNSTLVFAIELLEIK